MAAPTPDPSSDTSSVEPVGRLSSDAQHRDSRNPQRAPRRPTSPDGILVVDKPQGITSHDVVARLRRLCGTRAVGHGGTLDPMATGVLICGIGKGTKLLTFVSGSDKAYSATIRLGVATTTDDAEGETSSQEGARLFAPTPSSSCASSLGAQTQDLTLADIDAAIANLTGEIQQVPTSVSAIKVDGKRAYHLVREGEEVNLAARPVTVSKFQVNDVREVITPGGVPVIDLDVDVVVSSGTYVRALARDLGQALGVGGHLTKLRRTRIGNVGLGDALDGFDGHDAAHRCSTDQGGLADWRDLQAQTLEELEQRGDEAYAQGRPLPTIPLAAAAGMFLPIRKITDEESADLRQGKFISRKPTSPGTGDGGPTDTVTAAIGPTGELVAIIEPANATKAKPKVVFPWVQ